MLTVKTNLEELNKALADYVILSGKTVEEALRKQGAKIGFLLRQELFGIAPAKGSIRTQMLSRLAAKQGVRVRPSVLQKLYQSRGVRSQISDRAMIFGKKGVRSVAQKGGGRLNLWALAVKSEINLRESARGFLGVSALYKNMKDRLESAQAFSRYGPLLSQAGFKFDPTGGSIEFKWGAGGMLSSSAAEGLTKAKGESAIDRALRNTLEDIEVYLTRKFQETWLK